MQYEEAREGDRVDEEDPRHDPGARRPRGDPLPIACRTLQSERVVLESATQHQFTATAIPSCGRGGAIIMGSGVAIG
jgi:hypothetical protein